MNDQPNPYTAKIADIDSDMGRVTEKNLIHSAITKIEKVN